MSKTDQEIVGEVFCEVLENLAFMFGDPPEPGDPVGIAGAGVMAEMRFDGPRSGRLFIAVPESACPMIASNVLGVDPDDPDLNIEPKDALKELLNVTCGHVVTALGGEDPVFQLTVPTLQLINEDAWSKLVKGPQVTVFLVDEQPYVIGLEPA